MLVGPATPARPSHFVSVASASNISPAGYHKFTVVQTAAHKSHISLVKFLLETDVDVNASPSHENVTVPQLACVCGLNEKTRPKKKEEGELQRISTSLCMRSSKRFFLNVMSLHSIYQTSTPILLFEGRFVERLLMGLQLTVAMLGLP